LIARPQLSSGWRRDCNESPRGQNCKAEFFHDLTPCDPRLIRGD
jgi:hypothetical protein